MKKDIESQVAAIRRAAEKQVECLADQYRQEVIVPICKKLNLIFLVGNGLTNFYTDGGEGDTIGSAEMARLEGRPELVPIFEVLDSPGLGGGRDDVFGYYVRSVKASDLKVRR